MISIKSDREIKCMQDAGRVVCETHDEVEKAVKAGISTKELDQIAEDFIISKGATPSFKGYGGFPASICASKNEIVVHGIPNKDDKLSEGDIISVDIGAILNGYQGDAARTHAVGRVSEEAQKLLEVTEASLYKGIENAQVGNRLSDISYSIQSYVEKNGFSVVRDFCGHGIGKEMHEQPQIPNFGRPGHGSRLKAGMCLAIEPMVNVGTYEVTVLEDKWTTVTNDGKLSAHFEHSVAVTDDGPLILTKI